MIDKDPKNTIEPPEVVTEPLTSFKDDDSEMAAPKLVRVTYFPRGRRTFCVHLMLTIMVMVILTCGAIGAVVFYRHLNKKEVYTGRCGTRYYDPEYHELRGDLNAMPRDPLPHQRPGLSMYKTSRFTLDFLEESIEVSRVDAFEQLHTPSFDEVRENTVWHDFQSNYTAIIDRSLRSCYIMNLDRKAIAPPSDVLDLLKKLLTGYYMKSAAVMRQNYHLMLPPVMDMSPYGSRIKDKCSGYESYRLEKYVRGVFKRSAESKKDDTLVYAVLTNKVDHPEMFKIVIHGLDALKPAV